MRVCVNVRGSIRLNSSIHSAWFRSSRLSFIHSFSLFPIEQLIFLRFQYNIEISFIEIFIYVDERRKQKFQFLSVFFFFFQKQSGTRREIFLFHRNDVYNGGGIAFRVERFPCHSKGSSYLFLSEPGFRSSVCKSVDTYLRGASCLIFIPERLVPRSNEIACNLRFFPPFPPLFPPRPRYTRSSWTFGRIFDAYPTLITLHGVSTEGKKK